MSHGANPDVPERPAAAPATVLDDPTPQLTRSYAEALLRAAESSGSAEPVLDELDALIAGVWDAQPRFAALLGAPTVASAEKDRILRTALEGRIEPLLLNFLRVLNRNGRLDLLRVIAQKARAELDRKLNRRPVSVRAARPLDDDQLAALRGRLTGLLGGATPVLHVEVDPSLVGGLTVQVGDYVYDGSVRGRLDRIRRQLAVQKSDAIRSRAHSLVEAG